MSHLGYISDTLQTTIEDTKLVKVYGKVSKVTGSVIEASIPGAKIGELCVLQDPNQDEEMMAEVIGFTGTYALLTPIGDMQGLSSDTRVYPSGKSHEVQVSSALLGHVIDGMGRPLDAEFLPGVSRSVHADPPDPLRRKLIDRPLGTGIKAIDGLISIGEGQRVGIFAPSGVGKSTLLGSMARGADVDVVVCALIGERGREVREFIEKGLGPDGMKKTVVVVATSDRPTMERVKAAYVATTVAEHFRDQGKKVLLLMDSVTRFARSLREIGLAAGEPPTRRGFPPSVFAALPKLLERAGNSEKGSITAFYTVLVEGDDMTEPVADEVQSILDGHIILSRKIARAGQYPAIDVLNSLSRVMPSIVDKEHDQSATAFRELLSRYEDLEFLIKVGEYKAGSSQESDEAIRKIGMLKDYLKQHSHDVCERQQSIEDLRYIVNDA